MVFSNVLSGITKEIEIRKESIFNHFIPIKLGKTKFGSSFVVLVQCCANGLRASFQGIGDVFTEAVS
jgi:hypothetical protein